MIPVSELNQFFAEFWENRRRDENGGAMAEGAIDFFDVGDDEEQVEAIYEASVDWCEENGHSFND